MARERLRVSDWRMVGFLKDGALTLITLSTGAETLIPRAIKVLEETEGTADILRYELQAWTGQPHEGFWRSSKYWRPPAGTLELAAAYEAAERERRAEANVGQRDYRYERKRREAAA